jgi:hypothetical protein
MHLKGQSDKILKAFFCFILKFVCKVLPILHDILFNLMFFFYMKFFNFFVVRNMFIASLPATPHLSGLFNDINLGLFPSARFGSCSKFKIPLIFTPCRFCATGGGDRARSICHQSQALESWKCMSLLVITNYFCS